MKNLKQRFTNPMTIIAIFATLSETSAAVCLPFLDNEERAVYIWFLICFPFYLLLLFFATLNFNYRSLYAPSDYEKGEHFINALESAERPETAQGPPDVGPGKHLSVQHHIELPERLKDLHIVDARSLNRKMEFRELLKKIHPAKAEAATVVVFLISGESEEDLKEGAYSVFRRVKKRSGLPYCVAYNLSSQDVTLIEESREAQRPVAF